MDLIGGLMARYQKLFKDKELESSLVTETIKKQTGFVVSAKDFSFKDGVLSLKLKPKYKLEIFLKKEGVLKDLEEKGLRVFQIK